ITPQVKEMFRKKFHLDRPIYEQYWLNMRDLFSGRLKSIKDDRPVLERIFERMPATITLNIASILLSLTFGLLLGIYCAKNAGRPPDFWASLGAFVFIAVPTFWIANLAIIGLVKWTSVPVLGTQSYGIDFPNFVSAGLDRVWHVALPAVILSLGGIAVQSRYIRASMLETLREDYIRTARAKGLEEDVVFYKHALRNSIRPLITGIGGLLPALIGGSVIVEMIFAYPGMGRLGYEAALERDYPTLVALNFIVAGLVLIGNLVSDILYAIVDPRVRLE
ncbi:ABC transporter permease, partial [Patescibacteria group bacterium]|nr:ABC transporter permease [Patescibacteria group bacterium]